MPERNEELCRALNDEIEKLGRGLADISDQTFHIVCECGALSCFELVVVPTVDYERIRTDETLFIVKPGHYSADDVELVEANHRYQVVRNAPPKPQSILLERSSPSPWGESLDAQ